ELFDVLPSVTPAISLDIFQLACRSSAGQVPLSEALTRLDRYSHFGMELPTAKTRETICNISLSRDDLVAMSFRLDGKMPYLNAIGGPQLLYASAALHEPLGHLHHRLERLAVL